MNQEEKLKALGKIARSLIKSEREVMHIIKEMSENPPKNPALDDARKSLDKMRATPGISPSTVNELEKIMQSAFEVGYGLAITVIASKMNSDLEVLLEEFEHEGLFDLMK